ncbi:MAG: glycoside hydrolase, beta-N-acetylhexosaminidase, partial [candidate division WS6 bacterium GW2011_GWC1_33_20]
MQLFIKSILAVIFTLSFLSTTISKIGDLYSKDSPYLVQKISIEETLLESMSVEEKVGQLFMFGFYGTTPTEHITKYITDKHIGGILLLGYNIENSVQLENLITQLQSSSSIPLLISIDQEGGIVSRLTWNDILTFPQKNISSGQQGYDIAYQRGLQLKEIGINMNLA